MAQTGSLVEGGAGWTGRPSRHSTPRPHKGLTAYVWLLPPHTVPSPGFWRLHIECQGQALPGAPFSVLAADPEGAALEAPAPEPAAAEPATVQRQEGNAEPAAANDGADNASSLQQAPQPAAAAATAAAAAAAAAPIRDEMRVWERIAAAAFAEADGSMEGWDSDSDKPWETKEDKYIRVRLGLSVCAASSVAFGQTFKHKAAQPRCMFPNPASHCGHGAHSGGRNGGRIWRCTALGCGRRHSPAALPGIQPWAGALVFSQLRRSYRTCVLAATGQRLDKVFNGPCEGLIPADPD